VQRVESDHRQRHLSIARLVAKHRQNDGLVRVVGRLYLSDRLLTTGVATVAFGITDFYNLISDSQKALKVVRVAVPIRIVVRDVVVHPGVGTKGDRITYFME